MGLGGGRCYRGKSLYFGSLLFLPIGMRGWAVGVRNGGGKKIKRNLFIQIDQVSIQSHFRLLLPMLSKLRPNLRSSYPKLDDPEEV
jgi:hypothetical protein